MSRSASTSSIAISARAAISASVGARPSVGSQLLLGAHGLALALEHVGGDADRALLVLHAALDRLADPVGGVGGELEAAAPVVLLGRADQPEDPLLDEVQQRQAVGRVALGDRDDQRQVGGDHPLLGGIVAVLDPLGELDLLGGGQQRMAADLAQEERQRVGGRARQVAVAVVRCGDAVAPAVVGQLDAATARLVLDRPLRLVVELESRDERGDVGQAERAGLFCVVEKAGHRGALRIVEVHVPSLTRNAS